MILPLKLMEEEINLNNNNQIFRGDVSCKLTEFMVWLASRAA